MSTIPIKNTATNNLTITIPGAIPGAPGSSASTISIVGGGGGGGGTHGPIYTTNAQWANAASPVSGRIHVQGDAVFEGKITWQGRDMREWFEAVESRLNILRPNLKMEADWDELKELGDQYRALEKKLKEQQQVFDILKRE
jgi:hypothetical protein